MELLFCLNKGAGVALEIVAKFIKRAGRQRYSEKHRVRHRIVLVLSVADKTAGIQMENCSAAAYAKQFAPKASLFCLPKIK